MTKSPFTWKGEPAAELLSLIHIDVCRLMMVNAKGGCRCFITFTDDLSGYGYVFLIRHKSGSFEMFKWQYNEMEKQTGMSIRTLRSDQSGKYLSSEFMAYFEENAILSQWTPPGTPQLYGVSEGRNRTLLDMVRSIMGFCDSTAVPLGMCIWDNLSLVPSKSVVFTPYEIWIGCKRSILHLWVWSCLAYVKHLD